MLNDVTVFNIREYLSAKGDKDLGEDELRQLLSEFFCDKNPDVERFLKEQSIEFTKKNQSVTYVVFSNEDASLVGYFTITIKPITVNAENFSNTMKRKIARVSELDEENGTLGGTLSINECFFVDKKKNRKVCSYIKGYCTGVIETLLGDIDVELTCVTCPMKNKFKSECVFEIALKMED